MRARMSGSYKALSVDEFANESFMYRKEDAAANLCQSIKNLFLNLQYFTFERYKIDFFISTLKRDLNGLGDAICRDIDMLDTLKDRADQLAGEIDEELLAMLEIHNLIASLESCRSMDMDHRSLAVDSTITDFASGIETKFDALFSAFLTKQKGHPEYQPLKTVSIKGSVLTYEEYMRLRYYIQVELLKFEEWVAEHDKKVLVMFEGRDAAGKSGAVNFLTENMNPKHYKARYFGIPDKLQKIKWFDRYTESLPRKGEIVFFDRTYYVRGYMDPIMGYCDQAQYEDFMSKVNEYERMIRENGIKVMKFWLSVDRNNQTLRFEKRKSDPLRYWKFSENDKKTIKKWDEFTAYINCILKKTNKYVKWRIVDSNDELLSKIKIARQILESFDYDGKDLSFFDKAMPKPAGPMPMRILPTDEALDTNKKVLFLDIDGVLIPFPEKSMVDHELFDYPESWNIDAMNSLNRIIDETRCEIIISSSYRKYKSLEEIQMAMTNAGFRHAISGEIAKNDEGESRAELVKKWLSDNGVSDYCVIDDSRHMFPEILPKGRVVKPSTERGLTDELADEAIEILSIK